MGQSTQRETAPVVADLFSDRTLLVSGWSTEDLERILTDFASKYEDLQTSFRHVVFVNGAVKKVSLPNDFAPDMLSFLVNYVNYPEGFDLKGRNIAAIGMAILTSGFHAPSSEVGKKAFFYVPSNDKDYDQVYVRVGSHTYAQSFTTMRWKQVTEPRLSASTMALVP